jgi:hypothetical protein
VKFKFSVKVYVTDFFFRRLRRISKKSDRHLQTHFLFLLLLQRQLQPIMADTEEKKIVTEEQVMTCGRSGFWRDGSAALTLIDCLTT